MSSTRHGVLSVQTLTGRAIVAQRRLEPPLSHALLAIRLFLGPVAGLGVVQLTGAATAGAAS